ncbi:MULTISPECIES: SAM-dependent methyltransferase [unclassified Micromonospora]|uniref:SAM-dependent methyltransferase n=1 Tax=unclassified Micromonospora TaxID=2617518 RepID=UPI001C240C9F|nr:MULTISPECIES: SAM-dependent methyltransferase [unclassified Micromonospora]MBU8857810.1 SAM-dependent methyltransferase [Micromonospora sp. WMMB482]MDM4783441.1 SAM-dependent methyltransferase [Micromonospora sp. b486]
MTDQQKTTPTTPRPRATVARIYDYLLGGKQNFEADRRAARDILSKVPAAADLALSNRLFLRRAVQTLAEAGMRQFLDLGSGIPTQGNVHEIAQAVDPEIRVLYVDIDPVAVVASNQILDGNLHCRAIEADFTQPDVILDALADKDAASIINLDEPLAVLYCSVLQLIPDDQIDAIITPIRDLLVPGSAMVISHVGVDVPDRWGESTVHQATDVFRTQAATDIHFRTDEQLTALFSDFEMIDPGLVPLDRWRPELSEPDPFVAASMPSPMRGAVAFRR